MAIKAVYIGVNDQMSIDDVKQYFSEKLNALNLDLEIERDCNASNNYIQDVHDEFDIEIVDQDSKGYITYDLNDPYDFYEGFDPCSLFVYLNDENTSRQLILSTLTKYNRLPDCFEVEDLLETFRVAMFDFQDNRLDSAYNYIDKAYSQIESALLENRNFHDWMMLKLGPTARNTEKHLEDTNLNYDYAKRVSFHIHDFKNYLDECREDEEMPNPDVLERYAKQAVNLLSSWVCDFKASLGGEYCYVDYLKSRFARRFGASSPAAYVDMSDFTKDLGIETNEILIVHENDGYDINDLQTKLINVAKAQVAGYESEVYGYAIIDRNTDDFPTQDGMSACYNFYGSDFEKNGLITAIEHSLNHIAELRQVQSQNQTNFPQL